MCAPEPPYTTAQPQAFSSRRRRLWEIQPKHHCSIVGVCFNVKELRTLVSKLTKVPSLISDFELHRCTVKACESRGSVSELLQKTLEKRHALIINQFRTIHSRQELSERWCQALVRGNISETLWAVLTHPYCNDALAETIYGELHMLQHQVGSAQRQELTQLHAVQREKVVLLRELASAQARTTQDRDQRIAEINQLRAENEDLRRKSVGQQEQLAHTQRELHALRCSLPDMTDRERLNKRAHTAEAQCYALRASLREQERAAEHWQQMYARLTQTQQPAVPSSPPVTAERCANAGACNLSGKQVLCIGGRPGVIEFYRQLVEDQGGSFSHHDGGMEENISMLEPSIAAADAVICQAGCINHNAYWRVKDFCKRTGKPCVFVKSTGVSSFQRSLQRLLSEASQI